LTVNQKKKLRKKLKKERNIKQEEEKVLSEPYFENLITMAEQICPEAAKLLEQFPEKIKFGL
jgi:hypothetical protein